MRCDAEELTKLSVVVYGVGRLIAEVVVVVVVVGLQQWRALIHRRRV